MYSTFEFLHNNKRLELSVCDVLEIQPKCDHIEKFERYYGCEAYTVEEVGGLYCRLRQ